jgi:hypothetical protein
MKRTYRLASSSLVHAPGMLLWLKHGYDLADGKDQANRLDILGSWEGVPTEAAIALLTGEVPYTLDGDTVVFEHDDPLFRDLGADEADVFRRWARENYIPGQSISQIWHPVVQDECHLINGEQSNG